MTSAAVATGSPLWSLAVWEEDREEEGVLPTIWIQGNSVRWPRGKNTERKMAEMCAPDGNWDTFPLVKVTIQSGLYQIAAIIECLTFQLLFRPLQGSH
jgi:hypothetical protein